MVFFLDLAWLVHNTAAALDVVVVVAFILVLDEPKKSSISLPPDIISKISIVTFLGSICEV